MANGPIRMNYLAVGVPRACDQLRQGRGTGVQTSYWLAFERLRRVTDILIAKCQREFGWSAAQNQPLRPAFGGGVLLSEWLPFGHLLNSALFQITSTFLLRFYIS
ncbi:hypothetical protein QQF64_023476 [Cirrhinus molitorella]|uniref:Uncharacterized protein n=1 Tax=Cirrhinus molitorella TaxID=172907 RepID=A0ABR3L713_9TELE